MAFITIAGQNKIAYQQGHGLPLEITGFVLAYIADLGAEPADRIESLPDGANIVHSHAYTRRGYVNANLVVYSLVMDTGVGPFDFNWVGLVDADGVLIAVAHIATQTKRATDGEVQGNVLTRNFLLAYSGIQAITGIAVPAETWQIDFTARLWGIDGRERLSNLDIYGASAFFGDGFNVSRVSGTDYTVAAGVGYVGGIRAELAADEALTVSGPPKSVWADVSLQGDISGVAAVVAFTATASTLTDYTDGLGFDHYVALLADVAADGTVTDRRTKHLFQPLADTFKTVVSAPAANTAYPLAQTLSIGAPGKLLIGAWINIGGAATPPIPIHADEGYRLEITAGGDVLEWENTAYPMRIEAVHEITAPGQIGITANLIVNGAASGHPPVRLCMSYSYIPGAA